MCVRGVWCFAREEIKPVRELPLRTESSAICISKLFQRLAKFANVPNHSLMLVPEKRNLVRV